MATFSQIDTGNVTPADRKKNRSYRRLIVFLVCLIISILMWFFVELMKNYSDEIKYTVKFKNVPKDLILTNSADSIVSIGMNAQGFELLGARFFSHKRILEIDLSNIKIRPSGDGYTAFLSSSKISEQLFAQIKFHKEILYIKPDTLFFRFATTYRKQVAVKPDIEYSVSGQYDLVDSLAFNPQYITVAGPKSIIDTITFVKTKKILLNGLDSSLRMKVMLDKGIRPDLVKYSTDSILVKLQIEEVTEAGYMVPLIVNSSGKNIKVFPDKVEIICRVPLSRFSQVDASDFVLQVDYNPEKPGREKLPVELLRSPDKVRVMKIVPDEVEYIIISK